MSGHLLDPGDHDGTTNKEELMAITNEMLNEMIGNAKTEDDL